MSERTQEPWKIEPEGAYEEYWVTRDHYTVGPAKIVYDIADARLISAAPDLLQALQGLLAMPDYDGTPETSRARLKAKNKAKAAIKKATQ